MSLTKLAAAAALAMLIAPKCSADDAPFVGQDRTLAPLRQPEGLAPEELAAYFEVADRDQLLQPYAQTEYQGEPSLDQSYSGQPSVDCASSDEHFSDAAVGCCEVCGCGDACHCATNYRGGWTFGVDVSALWSDMATRDADVWPDDVGHAGRVTLGYEWRSGFGMRTQAWGYWLEGTAYRQFSGLNHAIVPYWAYDDWYTPGYLRRPLSNMYPQEIEVSASTAFLDFYKSFTSRDGELLLGAGPAFGHLEFSSPPPGGGAKYYGGGISVFGQGCVPFIRHRQLELALTGQARVSLLTGDWEVEYGATDTTHSKSMSILELGIGPEIRCRFGQFADRYWFLRTLAEIQQWRSDQMGPMMGDTLALQGATVNFGVNW